MKALYWKLRARDPRRLLWRWRRLVLVTRARLTALWFHASLDIDVAPDVRIGRHVRIEITPDTANVLHAASGAQLLDRVHILLRGGSILLGRQAQVRKDTTLNVSGRLVMHDRSILGYACVVHCAESIELAAMAGCAEQVTLADSSHYFTAPDEWFYDNVRTGPIHVGFNTWLCPRVTVTSGVRIGDHCIVGANSVVHRDVPDGHLASGVPAERVRPIDLPWRERSA